MSVNETAVLRGFHTRLDRARLAFARVLILALGPIVLAMIPAAGSVAAPSAPTDSTAHADSTATIDSTMTISAKIAPSAIAPATIVLRPADGSLLSALLYRPEVLPPQARALVWMGRDTTSLALSIRCLGPALAEQGIVVLAPRERTRAARRPMRGSGEVFHDRQGDGVAALGYLVDSLAIPLERVVLAGEETGAALAAWSASRMNGAPAGFVFVNPRFVVGGLDVLPIIRAFDRPCLALVEEEVAWSFESGRSLYLSLRSRCRLWQIAGGGGRLSYIWGDVSSCAEVAFDVAQWIKEGESPTP